MNKAQDAVLVQIKWIVPLPERSMYFSSRDATLGRSGVQRTGCCGVRGKSRPTAAQMDQMDRGTAAEDRWRGSGSWLQWNSLPPRWHLILSDVRGFEPGEEKEVLCRECHFLFCKVHLEILWKCALCQPNFQVLGTRSHLHQRKCKPNSAALTKFQSPLFC